MLNERADTTNALGGIVYVLSNDAMPGLIKIGRTSGDGVGRRVAELSRSTGVPLPFKVEVARSVHDAVLVEKALHVAFSPERINPVREFFSIEAHRAVILINAFPGNDLTPQIELEAKKAVESAEPGSLAAAQSFRSKRRPTFNFAEMNIPPGSILSHIPTGETVTVIDHKKVEFREEAMSLTRALRNISGAAYDVQPTGFWSYNGQTLREIYDLTYPHFSDDGIE